MTEKEHNISLMVIAMLACAWFAWFLYMETLHMWKPFEGERFETLVEENGVVTATIDLQVFRRYPVRFRDRLVHLSSGKAFYIRDQGSMTGQIGEFTIQKSWLLPAEPRAGRWCHVTEYEITYPRSTQFGVYLPIPCVDVK